MKMIIMITVTVSVLTYIIDHSLVTRMLRLNITMKTNQRISRDGIS